MKRASINEEKVLITWYLFQSQDSAINAAFSEDSSIFDWINTIALRVPTQVLVTSESEK